MAIVIAISVVEEYYNVLHLVDLQLQSFKDYIMSCTAVWKICLVDKGGRPGTAIVRFRFEVGARGSVVDGTNKIQYKRVLHTIYKGK